jgi:hypothetical protein
VKFPSCAIPLYVPKSERTTLIGTGFLGRRGGEVGLLTAAHMPIGIQPFATAGWVGWPHEILSVPDPTGSPQPVHLFDPEQSARTPVFSYRVRSETTGFLHDMIGFFGPVHEPAISALEEVYEVIDLESESSEPSKGTALTALGYPDRGGATTWPYHSARRSSGPFERVADDGLLEAAFAPADGLLGGPVFTDKAEFVGMVVGAEDGAARIHGRAELLAL